MTAEPQVLTAVFVDPDDDSESVLGQLAVDEQGQLEVVFADGPCQEFLEQVTDSLNAKGVVNVKVPGSRRGAVGAKFYTRGEEDFLSGVKQYVKQFYALDLRSNKDIEEEPEDFAGLS